MISCHLTSASVTTLSPLTCLWPSTLTRSEQHLLTDTTNNHKHCSTHTHMTPAVMWTTQITHTSDITKVGYIWRQEVNIQKTLEGLGEVQCSSNSNYSVDIWKYKNHQNPRNYSSQWQEQRHHNNNTIQSEDHTSISESPGPVQPMTSEHLGGCGHQPFPAKGA